MLPKSRAQLLDSSTGDVISDVDIITSADSVLYENDNPIIDDFRGIKKNDSFSNNTTVKDIIDNILYPDINPIINYIQIGDIIYKKDSIILNESLKPVPSFTLLLNINTGSSSTLTFTINCHNLLTGEIKSTDKTVNVSKGSNYQFMADIDQITIDTNVQILISDGSNIVESPIITYKFQYPIFIGCIDYNELLGDDKFINNESTSVYFNTLIRNKSPLLEKKISDIKNQKGIIISDILYSNRELYPVILFPNTWNKPISITDSNNNDITSAFDYSANIMIRSNNNVAIDTQYSVYVCKNKYNVQLTSLSEISYNFISNKGQLDHIGNGIPILTGFDILSNIPCDNRTVVETYDKLFDIRYPYIGLIVYVKQEKSFFLYSSSKQWVPTNQQVYLLNNEPDESLGSWGDICINLSTGIFYQKLRNINSRWEEKGRINGVGSEVSTIPGPPGDAGTIDIVDVITLHSNEDARVENIGDKQNARLEIYIPRGENGQDGKSAYEIWKELDENSEKTEQEFIESLKGEKGDSVAVRIGNISPGERFNVVNSGTASNVVLDFTYPKELDIIKENSIYPIGSIFQTTNHSFNPNGTIPGTWEYIGSINTTTDGNTTVIDLYKNIGGTTNANT